MDIQEALKTVEALAEGIDPTTGEALHERSPCRDARVVEALRYCAARLRHPTPTSLAARQAENLRYGRPRNAGLPWNDAARGQLAAAFRSGATLGELARMLQRSRGAVLSELKRQGLVADYWHSRPDHADPAPS